MWAKALLEGVVMKEVILTTDKDELEARMLINLYSNKISEVKKELDNHKELEDYFSLLDKVRVYKKLIRHLRKRVGMDMLFEDSGWAGQYYCPTCKHSQAAGDSLEYDKAGEYCEFCGQKLNFPDWWYD